MDIHAMRQQRAQHAAAARALLDAAQEAGRDLTAEETESFDRAMEQADQLEQQIDREQRARDLERTIDRTPEPDDHLTAPGGRPGGDQRDAEARAFGAFLAHGRAALTPDQARDLNMGSDPEGGYLVAPQQFVEQLLQEVDDAVPLRGLATVQTLTMGESLGVPTLDTDLADADWTSELATGALDDALRFGKRELRPHPLAKRVLVSRTLLRRASLGPETIVRQRMSYKFSVTTEKGYLTGDGNQKPLGVFTASSQGISTARDVDVRHTGGILDPNTSATGGAADDLINAKYALKSQYWPRARWLFHRFLIRDIRKLKDADGQYLWQPGLAGDRPDTILDVPFVVSEFAPNTIVDDAYIGMIADFSHYWIVESLQFEIQRLNELYAESNQVGFIGRQEIDAMPTLEEPFIRLKAVTAT